MALTYLHSSPFFFFFVGGVGGVAKVVLDTVHELTNHSASSVRLNHILKNRKN